ncbi:Aste57867_8006 [Aphanomyces stellatus]|uniref:Aste57867_5421 protein n=1 Tax=Aphanomyces stellatus TaxID=120398 RepID=A0A485KEK5_9STRA|nr:hypothetical protein As57867_007976 [Aphanomyces stellatus]KAF0710999.1 hypothetical protein As57867_005408 [Aphanomyces stellatus]VFT82475.1 Aste57867_5421 [Aphanomyces stellatus]VFT84899.1 Aste57867_8006 [Aphanomyces stellatus]
MESTIDIPPDHAWLVPSDLTFSRHILGRCIGASDDVFPLSINHVDFAKRADAVLKGLKQIYGPLDHNNTDKERPLQEHVDNVDALLNEAWKLKCTKLLELIMGDLVDQLVEIIFGKVNVDNLSCAESLCLVLDSLVNNNPQKHDDQKFKKHTTQLKRFISDMWEEKEKLQICWTVPEKIIISTVEESRNEDIMNYFEENKISADDERRRIKIVQSLERAIKKSGEWKKSELKLYGSSLSTMGVKGCDMDLSLTWNDPGSNSRSLSAMIGEARRSKEASLLNRNLKGEVAGLLDQAQEDLKKSKYSLQTIMDSLKQPDQGQKIPSKK